nr:barttin isoform X2 [Anas platyrhynchos]
MAEEKTFRYGFIMLGFFLVMTGMFIMSVEKPQIYITFCAVGVLLVAVGITWSMCQCYPRVTFVPVHPEAEWFLADKPTVPTEKNSPGKLCPQAPYSSAYEKSLPSYEQVQRQASAQPRPRSCSQPAVQAKAEVHRELGGGQDPPQEPQPRPETSSCPPRTPPEDRAAGVPPGGPGHGVAGELRAQHPRATGPDPWIPKKSHGAGGRPLLRAEGRARRSA